MSYILDALKKAQAERELGRVPAVQQALQPAVVVAESAAPSMHRPLWAAGAGIVLLVVLLGIAWSWREAPPPRTTPVAVATPSTPALVPPGPPTPPTPSAAPAPIAATPVAAAPVALPPVLPAPTPAPAAVAAAATAAATAAEPIPLESLDAPTRARLPTLTIGGTILSPDRSQRMVIIDGQVLREGDRVAAELIVQTIDAEGVLLKLGSGAGQRLVRIKTS
jgi:general secretion pathway protein B